jgi:ketosteroid isomerase-like protein
MASKNVETALAFQEATFRDDYEACGQLVGDPLTTIDRPRGRIMRTPEELLQGFEDDQAWSHRRLQLERAMETTDGAVVLQFSERATHVGTWYGVAPTGKEVAISCCIIYRFDADGRIILVDVYEDHLSIAIQFGVVDLS